MRAPHGLLLAGMAVVALAGACRRVDGPNIVLVTLDTTRADRLGVMGDRDAKTPVLDALAARGTLFERAYTSVPLTLPSHTTILTGLDPNVHGVHDNGHFVVPPSVKTVAERLKARGYATAAFVSAFVLDAGFGLNRGFATYDDDVERSSEPLRLTVPRRPGQEVTDRALGWLAQPRRVPFFLWVHYYDVHSPRLPPPPFDAMEDKYAGALAYVDAQVSRLLDGLAHAAPQRETLVIVVGDHGESLGEHEEMAHGIVAYDSTLHVPLIVAGPGFTAGKRSRAFVRTADVTPTILAAVGLPPVTGSRGRPLQELVGGTGTAEQGVGYFECFGPVYNMGWARIAGVRTTRWKYTAEPDPPELYDVTEDPLETHNRVDDEPGVVAELKGRYAAMRSPLDTARRVIPLHVQEQLAALGYTSVAPRPDAVKPVDPRRLVGAYGWIEAARELPSEGRVADGLQALEILASAPISRLLALRSLAPLYLAVGRTRDAIASYEQLLTLSDAPEVRVGLAAALLAADRPQEALARVDEAMASPGGLLPPVRLAHARILLRLGRSADAERDVEAVLADDAENDTALALASRLRAARDGASAEIPRLQKVLDTATQPRRLVATRTTLAELLHSQERDAEAVALLEATPTLVPEQHVLLAEIAVARGNPAKAVAEYEAALAERPTSQEYRRALAELYAASGRVDAALELYAVMIGIDPGDATLLVDRGALLAKAGRAAEAEADYRRAISVDSTIPEAFFNLALLELAAGREGDAESDLLRATQLRPDYSKALLQLARLYGARGDPRGALYAERAVKGGTGTFGSEPPAGSTKGN